MMDMMGGGGGGGFCIKHNIGNPFRLQKLFLSIQKPKVSSSLSSSCCCLLQDEYYHITNTRSMSASPRHFGSSSCFTTTAFSGLIVHQMGEHGVGRELNEQTTGSSRWSPTPEQLLALEEIYRHGTRSPTTEQIQKIAATLRRFGKVEGKNVYYWFQNHKARERNKRRRQVQNNHGKQTMNMKESGFPELQPLKRMAIPTQFSQPSERFVSSGSPFKEKELQESSRDDEGDYASWPPIQLINSSTTTSTKFSNLPIGKSSLRKSEDKYLEDETREVQTLQLFPDNCYLVIGTEEDKNVPIRVINTNSSPNKFFEFLPLKN